METKVTIIIATYNRPDTLKSAVLSVLSQTVLNWKLLVIGDCCGSSTDELMDSIKDERVRYINLSHRFGEQSGPNSVGMALAKTPYIAFLNHDDIWLPDHLELGLNLLESTRYDFYMGGTAYSRYLDTSKQNRELYLDEIITTKRKTSDFFKTIYTSIEPASCWIMSKEIVTKIGHWNYYSELYRTPIEDFALRGWRMGATFYFSPKVTVWAIKTQNNIRNQGNLYSYNSGEHETVSRLISAHSGDESRVLMEAKFQTWKQLGKAKKSEILDDQNFSRFNRSLGRRVLVKVLKEIVFNKLCRHVFKKFGYDIFVLKEILLGNPKGRVMKNAITIRTNEIPPRPDLEHTISELRKERFY